MTVEQVPAVETYHQAITELNDFVGGLDLTPRQMWRISNLVGEIVGAAREMERRDYRAANVYRDEQGNTWLRVPPNDGGIQ